MISVKTKEQLELMRRAGAITRDTLRLLEDKARAGVSTSELDKAAYEYILKCGAKPSFLNYHGYPASVCISIDEEVVHGIPSKKRFLEDGQIVSFDVGAFKNGYHGDAARTVAVGKISPEKQKLVEVTRQCFFEALKVLKDGVRLGDIGWAICSHARSFGYGVVEDLVGHGIGREMHEDPNVPNFGVRGRGIRLAAGMTIAIEPMINMGTSAVDFCEDGWTVKTKDRLPSAHYENTVALYIPSAAETQAGILRW